MCQMKAKTTVGNLTVQDMWQLREHRTRCAASVASTTDASGAPEKPPVKGLMAIFISGAINRSGGRPWLVLGTLGT
jgi:hypothetical protein